MRQSSQLVRKNLEKNRQELTVREKAELQMRWNEQQTNALIIAEVIRALTAKPKKCSLIDRICG